MGGGGRGHEGQENDVSLGGRRGGSEGVRGAGGGN